jgi:nucleoid-associated protein YgaU
VKVSVGPTTQPAAQVIDPAPGKVTMGTVKPGTYTIKAGDVLSVVSKEQLGSAKLWRKIVAANPGLDPDHLHVGQVINLPQVAAKPAPAAPMPLSSPDHMTSTADRLDNTTIVPVSNSLESSNGFHIVKAHENLSSIAREVYPHGGGTWKTLFAANRTALGNDPNGIRIGMKLVIPTAH